MGDEMEYVTDEAVLLSEINQKLAYLIEQFDRFKPLLERYEQAVTANSYLAQRRAMKGNRNG